MRRYQYLFDRAGNRTQQIVTVAGTPTTTNYSYNNANQLIGDGTNTFAYDNNGNLTTANGFALNSYDRANRLLGASDGVTTTQHRYDGDGRRTRQTVGATITNTLLDLQPGLAVVLAETTGANTTRFVHAPRGIHAHKDASNNWEWPLQDGLGSVRGVASNAAAVLESRNYEPFGTGFGATGTSQTPYGFTGEPTDGAGLVYL